MAATSTGHSDASPRPVSAPPSRGGGERFQVLGFLARSACWEAHQVFDRKEQRTAVMRRVGPRTEEERDEYVRLAETLERIDHPNVARLTTWMEQNGELVLISEDVPGKDVVSYVRGDDADPSTGFDEGALRHTLQQLFGGLTSLHAEGLHDVRLSRDSVRIDASGRVVILYVDPGSPDSTMAGEHADWRALGNVLYESLTGRGVPKGVDLADDAALAPSNVAVVPPDLDRLTVELLRHGGARPKELEALVGATGADLLRKKGGEAPEDGEPRCEGREGELATLHESFRAIRSKRLEVVWIEGASGIGKSTLVRRYWWELVQHDHPPLVLYGRCHEGAEIPYKGVDGLLEDLVGHLEGLPRRDLEALLPEDADLMRALFPIFDRLDVLPPRADSDSEVKNPARRRVRGFRALRELLRRVATREYVVVLLEDLQWSDADSWSLLLELVRIPEKAPAIQWVLSTRPGWRDQSEGVLQSIDALLAGCDPTLIRLGPLPEAAVEDLARRILGDSEVTKATIGTLAREAKGHPLLLETLLEHYKKGAGAKEERSLEDALWERVETLDPVSRRMVELIAVAARPLKEEVLFSIVGRRFNVDRDVFSSELDGLTKAAILRRQGGKADRKLDVHHDQLRSAVLGRLPEIAKKEVHRQLAQAFADHGGDPEELMVHYGQGGDSLLALAYGREAVARAQAAAAFGRAAQILEGLLAMLPEDSDEAMDAHRKRGNMLEFDGRCREAAYAYLKAASYLEGPKALPLRTRAAVTLMASGDMDEGVKLFTEVRETLGLRLPKGRRALLWSVAWGRIRLSIGKPEKRASRKPSFEQQVALELYWGAANVYTLLDPMLGGHIANQWVLSALRYGSSGQRGMALGMEAVVHTYLGSLHAGARLIEAAQREVDRSRDPLPRAVLEVDRAARASLRFDDAKKLLYHARQGLRWIGYDPTGATWEISTARLLELVALAHLGEYPELGDRMETYIQDARERGDVLGEAQLATTHDLFVQHLVIDRPDDAWELAARVLERLPSDQTLFPHLTAPLGHTIAMQYKGQPEEALETLEGLEQKARGSLQFRMPVLLALFGMHLSGAHLAITARAGQAPKGRAKRAIRRSFRAMKRHGDANYLGALDVRRAALAFQTEKLDAARTLLESARDRYRKAFFHAHVACCEYYLGLLIGGAEGEALHTAGLKFLLEKGVKAPDKFVRIFTPGFDALVEEVVD